MPKIENGWGEKWPAPAKLNLMLRIVGQRPDGYHLLQTVFQFIDLCDWISFHPADDGRVFLQNTLAGVAENDDLTIRAAKRLKAETACDLGVRIEVEKNLPMGGGLGGGSSDAATTLVVLNKLWNLNLSTEKLMQLGLSLGADVPVFVYGHAAWAEGVGEILSPIDLPEQYYAVLTPSVHVSTAQVFANSALTKDTKPLKIADFSRDEYSSLFRNDLENVVCKEFPAVASTLKWLNQYGQARMSGSGASVFVAVNSQSKANEILAQKPENTTGFVAKSLMQHPLYALAV